MDQEQCHDSGFTAGYSDGCEGRLKQLGTPIDLVLLQRDMIPHWRSGYEEGFAKGRADRRTVIAWRAAQHAKDRARGEEQNNER